MWICLVNLNKAGYCNVYSCVQLSLNMHNTYSNSKKYIQSIHNLTIKYFLFFLPRAWSQFYWLKLSKTCIPPLLEFFFIFFLPPPWYALATHFFIDIMWSYPHPNHPFEHLYFLLTIFVIFYYFCTFTMF